MTLLSAADQLAKLDRSKVWLNTGRCLHSQFNFLTCEACYTVCPVGAIHAGKPPPLEQESCKNCRACLPVCPTGAYVGDSSVGKLINCANRVEAKSLELVCELNPFGQKSDPKIEASIRIKGCLAGLGSGGLSALMALDIAEVSLRLDACAQCQWGDLFCNVLEQAECVNALMKGVGKTAPLNLVYEDDLTNRSADQLLYDAENPPLSRRGLFQMIGKQGQFTMARAIKVEEENGERIPGGDRRRLIMALRHMLDEEMEIPYHQLESFNFAAIAVSDECTACGVCAEACPTRALEISVTRKRFELRFSPQACIGCGVCVRLCAPEAIDLDYTPDGNLLVAENDGEVMLQGDLEACRNCRTLFSVQSGGRYCPLCEYRRKNPFGASLPPGLTALLEHRKASRKAEAP